MTPTILLLGGTSDTPPIARRLMERGYRVLVSQATDVPLETACHPNLESRAGRLDEHSLCELVERRGIRAIVDATHPYAVQIRALARRVADDKGIPYLCFLRPAAIDPSLPGVEMAPDHPAAAIAAFGRGRPVLLTTGTRNLGPYVERARAAQLPLVVRALEHPASLAACLRAGIPREHVLLARGPFSIADNRRHIRTFGIGVLVTKDSGVAGGVAEKLEAARAENCAVVVVARPAIGDHECFADVDALLAALADLRLDM
jgi:precorrin-6A/cobalt-precorrin-6A reductase